MNDEVLNDTIAGTIEIKGVNCCRKVEMGKKEIDEEL